MVQDAFRFFNTHPEVLPVYERIESQILAQIPDVRIRVSKSQIVFFNRHGFAWVSFTPVRKAKDRPAAWLTVTFGLSYQKCSPRIDAATKPYPNRWTHHVMISSPEEVDAELMDWIREAAAFSAIK